MKIPTNESIINKIDMKGGMVILQKRLAAIHDISGIGKCSLTAALPIISAAGIEAAAMPTAVLSTHTGDISGFTYRDLTGDMPAIAAHWHSLGIKFDAIYSGFLGSTEQVDIVADFIDESKRNECTVIVDPAMADSGEMYKTFNSDFADKMEALCSKADIIIPNITEAAILCKCEYIENRHTEEYIVHLLHELSSFSSKAVVLTGVSFEDCKIGCAVLDKSDNSVSYSFSDRLPGKYYGTGDIFASALTGAFLRKKTVSESTDIATKFVFSAIKRTFDAGTDPRFGVNFEEGLGEYIKMLEE